MYWRCLRAGGLAGCPNDFNIHSKTDKVDRGQSVILGKNLKRFGHSPSSAAKSSVGSRDCSFERTFFSERQVLELKLNVLIFLAL